MTAEPPAADSVAGQQTQTFHISTAATAVNISQLAIHLQSHYKEVEAVTGRSRNSLSDLPTTQPKQAIRSLFSDY